MLLTEIRERWRGMVLVLLGGILLLLLDQRFELGPVSFGLKSFARNVAIVGVAGVWLGVPGMRWPGSRLLAPLLTLLLACGASVAWNDGGWGEVRLLATSIGLFVTARSVLASQGSSESAVKALGLLCAGLLATEAFHNPGLLGLREELRNELVTMHPNTLGALQAFVGPVLLAAALRPGGSRLAKLAWSCSVVCVAMTFSRSAWLAFALGSGLVFLAARTGASPWRGLPVVGIALVGMAGLVGAVLSLSLTRHAADWQRIQILQTSLSLFAEHPGLGIGYGISNLREVFPGRYERLFGKPLFLFHSHDMYVDFLVGAGVVGLAAALWLFFRLFDLTVRRGLLRARTLEARIETTGAAASVAALLLLGLVDMPFYHAKIVLVLGLLWALVETRLEEVSDAGRRARREARLAAHRVRQWPVSAPERPMPRPDRQVA